jgi:hypothetical protein
MTIHSPEGALNPEHYFEARFPFYVGTRYKTTLLLVEIAGSAERFQSWLGAITFKSQ